VALPSIPQLAHVRAGLAARLQKQLSIAWIKTGTLYEVFAVLTALWQYDPTLVTGNHLTCAIQRLVGAEKAVGGPYQSNNTTSLAANAQIAIFTRLVAQPLPNVESFLASIIAAQHFETDELNTFDILHLLSRACPSPELTHYVAHHWQEGPWQTPYHQAIALDILKNELPTQQMHTALTLLCGQQKNSAQNPIATMALIIKLLHTYVATTTESSLARPQLMHKAITQAAKKMFSAYSEPLRSSGQAAVDRICQADKNFEITLLPQQFAAALKNPATLTNSQYTALGLASLYGWIAYTIYDDFLDSEGIPANLPIANIAMRASLDCFRRALPDHQEFQDYVQETFTAMDQANAWEVSFCRFVVKDGNITIPQLPRYGDGKVLAHRSFAHALAPIAVIAHQGLLRSRNAHHIASAFRHYLIARQLNDDLHDWLKDMQVGHANYVVAAILRDMQIKPGTYALKALIGAMQSRFRQTAMVRVCQNILRHTAAAKRAFAQSRLLHATNGMHLPLDTLEASARQALDAHEKAESFYQTK
jgi:hypothetical protein